MPEDEGCALGEQQRKVEVCRSDIEAKHAQRDPGWYATCSRIDATQPHQFQDEQGSSLQHSSCSSGGRGSAGYSMPGDHHQVSIISVGARWRARNEVKVVERPWRRRATA